MERSLKKYVVVVDEGLAPGVVANTVLHLGTQFGAKAPAVAGEEVKDVSGMTHSGLPLYPNVVLRASAIELRKCIDVAREQARSGELIFLDYPREGHLTSNDADYRLALGQANPSSMEYYACLIFGDRKQVSKLTNGFRLWV